MARSKKAYIPLYRSGIRGSTTQRHVHSNASVDPNPDSIDLPTSVPDGIFDQDFVHYRAVKRWFNNVSGNERINKMAVLPNVHSVFVVFSHLDNGTIVPKEQWGSLRKYAYMTHDGSIGTDDLVVVSVEGRLKICTVVEVLPNVRVSSAFKFVVDKINTKAYEETVLKAKRAVEIRMRLEEIAEQEKDRKKLLELAKDSEEGKRLLAELDELEGRKPSLEAAINVDTGTDTKTE